VLMDGNREVYYYPDTAVTSRQVCEIGPSGKMRALIVVPAGSAPSQTPACRSEPADPAPPANSPVAIQEFVHG